MGRSAYIPSYYADTAHAAPDRPALAGTVDCDVCVVGGGIAGCSTALHLAERGFSVVLLEAQRIAWGASGRSGAQAIFGIAAGQARLERLVGAADARRIWDVTIEGLALQRELIARHAIDCDYVPGQMQVALKARQEAELRAEVASLHERYDYRSIRMVEREELRSLLASERYVCGTHDPNCGHLHPLNYTLGLASAAERLGVRIFEGSRALTWDRGAGRLRVATVHGEVRCRQLALCGNAYLGGTAPALARRIMAVGTYLVSTAPLGAARATALIRNRAAVTDLNWVLDYFRLSADDRLLFGGRVSYSGLDPFGPARATRARMLAVFPQLADVPIEHAWGGYVDITMNRAPHFGRLEPDVYFVQGFSGHGIALTGVAGRLLAEAIAGTSARFDVFARIPHREFPGGLALRRPALVLAMAWYRLRDLL
ncbi:MAG: FAD-binding oxidoreductase [Steroidobacteraceae bacterium]|jgi:gamma-glutamylputrescine oxidase|nr:FAD-binding oxidoreductase [Steroidobacteraceae bacterium]